MDNICSGKRPLLDEPTTLQVSSTKNGVAVDIALRWSADMYTDSLLGFANGVHTPNGGTHIDGLKAAITRVLNAHARSTGKLREKAANLPGDFLREGLCAIVSVKMQEAEFEGQTKNRLGNPEVRGVVSEVTAEMLAEEVQRRPKALAAILDKALAAAKAAEAAKAARDLVRRKSVLGSSVLPGKLADCASANAAESEVFIVEGDSAGGSAKQGRRREFQAILPLRGKILNVEKSEDAAMYGNNEIQALITALGLGIKGEEFSAEQLRYHRIILMTDADVDGAHIRTLLLTFLYRYKREIVEQGYVYIAFPRAPWGLNAQRACPLLSGWHPAPAPAGPKGWERLRPAAALTRGRPISPAGRFTRSATARRCSTPTPTGSFRSCLAASLARPRSSASRGLVR